ncbi:MAG TPA: cupin domain-containing protein [Gaiellaceae bacterium]|jgi:quercetin dioxygenase-like cupin family protein
MTTATASTPLWFLATSVRIRVAAADGPDGLSAIESLAREGDSPPLHVHTTEDELFHVLEGELRVLLGDDELRLGAGETVLAPQGVAHTYRVESPRARWLCVTRRGDFERFVRALSRPAESEGLPPQEPPTPAQIEQLEQVAAEHGIRFVGPPL